MPKRLIAFFTAGIAATACGAVVSGATASSGSERLFCSRDDRQRVTNARPGAPATPLVPQGAMSLTICSYNGPKATAGAPQFGLLGTYQTDDAAAISRLTTELDAIKPLRPGVMFVCPGEHGSDVVLHFRYGSASVAVTVGTTGCDYITSGPFGMPGGNAPVIAQIEHLIRPVKLTWATVVGHIRLCGGPITPSGKTRCWTSADGNVRDVEAINSSNLPSATAQLHRGRFRFRIASPGRYTFKLVGNRTVSNVVLAHTRATVKIGATTRIVLLVPVP